MRNRVVIQQALVAMFFALIVVGSAQEGQAITPSAGDALILRGRSLTHVDSATGVETIVTCSDFDGLFFVSRIRTSRQCQRGRRPIAASWDRRLDLRGWCGAKFQ